MKESIKYGTVSSGDIWVCNRAANWWNAAASKMCAGYGRRSTIVCSKPCATIPRYVLYNTNWKQKLQPGGNDF